MGTPHLVLLHGQPGSRADWDAVADRLPGSRPVVAWDRPGYGDNRLPVSGLAGNARWLADRLAQAEIDDAILVGHSYGGGVALAAAAAAPDRVRGLVLIASIGPGCVNRWDALLAAPVAGPALAMAAWSVLPWVARQVQGHAAAPARESLQALAGIRHEHGRVWRSFLTEQRELLHGLDHWLDRVAELGPPVLIVADPADKVVPITTAHALHDRLPGSRLELVGAGGHQLPRRIPGVIAEQLGEFADSLG
ncbi:alpha/beta fold hydrolase [Nocardia sp. alder85J]|uniref:alpha/beta fold hydrolase n=1 Tax=Nocardia sp. alder85J TaxID=2862949 RepID=UPI001CD490C1|nr:alpha/beta hydrolase [Nocardia sp. alder85J]MCX4090862.1 alpha/beta hydrolase [Nocardia sp. alder85J]